MGFLPAAGHPADLVDLARRVLVAVCVDEPALGGEPEEEAQLLEIDLYLSQEPRPLPCIGRLHEALLDVDDHRVDPVTDRELVRTRKFLYLCRDPDKELEALFRYDLAGIGFFFHGMSFGRFPFRRKQDSVSRGDSRAVFLIRSQNISLRKYREPAARVSASPGNAPPEATRQETEGCKKVKRPEGNASYGSVLARRNPRRLIRRPGESLLRLAERRNCGVKPHEPPRITRSEQELFVNAEPSDGCSE